MKKILIIQTAFLGDVILTTPVIRVMKKAYPNSRIDVLLTPQCAEILGGMEEIHEVMAYDKRGKEKGVRGFLFQVRRIRERTYDICLAPHRSARTALLAFFSGAPVRICFDTAALGFLYTHRVPRPTSVHEIDRNLGLLSALGITLNGTDRSPVLPVDPRSREEADHLFREAGIRDNELLIGVGPGSVWGTKRWLPEGYAEVCDSLEKTLGAKVILLGGIDDVEVGERIMARSRGNHRNFVGRTTLKQAVGIMKHCRLYIGNDSALLHVASALQIPTVGIFGPTVPGQGFAPYGQRTVVVEKKEVTCRPCGAHGPMECPEGHFKCMAEISSQEVLEAAERLLVGTA